MEEDHYIELFNLFKDLGITESGIDKIYHYLLTNRRIEDLKAVCEDLDVNIKTAYKICSDLDELGLVHIYGRPMTIILKTPVIPIWQTIRENRIDELKQKFNNKRKQLDQSYNVFLRKYGLKEEKEHQQPVEYVDFDLPHLSDAFINLISNKFWKIAIGTPYETSIATIAKSLPYGKLRSALDTYLPTEDINKIKANLNRIQLNLIINDDVFEDFLQSKEFQALSQYYGTLNIEFNKIEVRVIQKYVSNFSLTNKKLVQPCFDPDNKLLGLYLSQKDQTYEAFTQKFKELFKEGVPVNTYLKIRNDLKKKSLTDTEKFTLTTL